MLIKEAKCEKNYTLSFDNEIILFIFEVIK